MSFYPSIVKGTQTSKWGLKHSHVHVLIVWKWMDIEKWRGAFQTCDCFNLSWTLKFVQCSKGRLDIESVEIAYLEWHLIAKTSDRMYQVQMGHWDHWICFMSESSPHRFGAMFQIQVRQSRLVIVPIWVGTLGSLNSLYVRTFRSQVWLNVLGTGGTLSLGRKIKCRVWTSDFVIEKKKGVHNVK